MRINELQKTTKPNIYEVKNYDGSKHYMVRFRYLNKNYPIKNFTKMYGCITLTQTQNKLNEIKYQLSLGSNPFEKVQSETINKYFEIYLNSFKNEKTKYVNITFYNKHIKPIIGEKQINAVTLTDLNIILNGTLKDKSDRTKKTLKNIMNPIFDKAIRNQKIKFNLTKDINFKKPKPKIELTSRVSEDLIVIAQKLYSQIISMNDLELKIIFLFSLMTVRRRSEILRLCWNDIVDNKVFVPENITKTNVVDEFPLSEIIINLLQSFKNEKSQPTDLLFTIKEDKVTRQFNDIVKSSNIQIVKNQKFTLHDCRNLFQSIMILKSGNALLVDRCISHNQNSKSILNVYLSFAYEDRKKVFEEYWTVLENKNIEEKGAK